MKPVDNTKIVIEYIKKYPYSEKLTLAKMIFAENPGKFKNVENIRCNIRYYYNAHGAANRRKKKSFEPPAFFNQIRSTPNKSFKPLKLTSGNALIIGDIHGYKHTPHLRDFFLWAKENKCDTIILNGDIMDCEDLGRWPKMEKVANFQSEIQLIRELLADIHDLFPKARKIYKKGNHELWWDKQLWNQNPNLMQAAAVSERLNLDDLLMLKDFGFEYVEDRQPIELGILLLNHGHEAKRGGMYIAKSMLEYYKRDNAFNHFHRTDYAQFQVYGGQLIKSTALPCACDVNASYTGINNQWAVGFGHCVFTETEYKLDTYLVENEKIVRK